jgi:hypothetical protein
MDDGWEKIIPLKKTIQPGRLAPACQVESFRISFPLASAKS